MNDRSAADNARLTGLVLASGVRSCWSLALSPVRRLLSARRRPPHRLLIAPQDIRTADPTVAADIYGGYFVFDGKALNTHGRSPFSLPAPTLSWAEALAGFGWLRHLRAADTALARVNARALVGDWIGLYGRPGDGPAWRPRVVARRILSWLSQSPLILDGADGFFYRRFMRSLGRQAVILQHAVSGGLEGETRLLAVLALTELGLCAEAFGKLQRQAGRLLVEEIGIQILPDGGHVSRDPGVMAELLLDLLPLRQAFVAAGVAPPPPLLNAIDRMIPMLRTFRHGDGTLALFNGMGVTKLDALATVFAHDDAGGRPLANAPYSGYQRLDANGTLVILDSGRPPPVAFSRRAHAGTLAFELSVGLQRVVINCGSPDAAASPAAREAARATAAHSTLVLDHRSSSRFSGASRLGRWLEGVLYSGPGQVTVARADTAQGISVEASHDGYLPGFGFSHRRRLALAAAGDRLEGEDLLVRLDRRPRAAQARRRHAKPQDLPFAIRFHLHFALRLQLIRNGTAAVIAFPTGDLWEFEAGGLPIAIEESIYFASAEGPRRIEQFVLRGQAQDTTRVAWSIARTVPAAQG